MNMTFIGSVTHLSQKGLGVVKNTGNNLSYFVYGTWPGDIGEFKPIDKPSNNKKFAYARLVNLIQPSSQRQIPPCPYLTSEENACTGCAWMIADYTSQLEQKRKRFVYAMQRVGFDTLQLNISPIHPAPQLLGYRNRCQVKTDGITLGFISENSHQIAPIKDCIVLNEPCRKLLTTAIQQLPNSAWQTDHPQNWNFIALDDDMPIDSIGINQKRPFKQGNTQQNTWMQSWLQEKLSQNAHLGKVVELFCGSGNFTQVIAASNCASVIAFESDAAAIQTLKDQHLAKVSTQLADLFDPFIWRKLHRQISDATTLILDPPRAGLKKHHGFFASFSALKTIYYISCNPETFARDAWFFHQNDWSISEIQLIDVFPHTPHIEVLAIFARN